MDELIDVLDETGVKTGKIATRDEVHQKGLWHRAIVVAIINKNDEILLQQRSYNKEKNAGMWDISVAGHVLANENSKLTSIREIKEEINVDCKESELEHILTYIDQRVIRDDFIENQFYDFYILRKDNIEISDITIQTSELEQVKYVNINKLKNMINERIVVDRPEVYKTLFGYISNKKC